MSERIGIVGVGRMGANMARRLNDQHFTITAISDVNSVAAKSLADELGSTYYEKLSHVTKNADVAHVVAAKLVATIVVVADVNVVDIINTPVIRQTPLDTHSVEKILLVCKWNA